MPAEAALSDPTLVLGILEGVFSALDRGDENAARAQLAEARRQFDLQFGQRQHEFGRTQGQSEGMSAIDVQRSLDNAPLRDKAMHMLKSRAPTQAFQPRDPLQPAVKPLGQASDPTGGIAARQAADARYRPGMGGVNTSTAETVRNFLLGNMGSQGPRVTGGTAQPRPVGAGPLVPPANSGTMVNDGIYLDPWEDMDEMGQPPRRHSRY